MILHDRVSAWRREQAPIVSPLRMRFDRRKGAAGSKTSGKNAYMSRRGKNPWEADMSSSKGHTCQRRAARVRLFGNTQCRWAMLIGVKLDIRRQWLNTLPGHC